MNPPRPLVNVIGGGAIAGSAIGEAAGSGEARPGTPAAAGLHRVRFVELGAEVAAIAAEDRPRDRLDQRALGLADQIAAQQVRAAGSVLPRPPRPVVEERGELGVHLVEIAGGILVEDDDVGAQPLQAPVLLRLQHLPHQRHVVVADDAHEQNRQIAGNAVRPQTRLTSSFDAIVSGSRAQRAVGEEHPRRQTLEQQRFVVRDAQMAQAALRVREGERERA